MDILHIETYIKCAWILLHDYEDTERQFMIFNKKYGKFLVGLIEHSQLTLTNLVISLYYIYKYRMNSINKLDENEMNIVNYIIISSLVLANKCYDDQSYTLKTWVNICNQQPKRPINIDLRLMNDLESHFMFCLNFRLNFSNVGSDNMFWDFLHSRLNTLQAPRLIINKFRLQVSHSTLPNLWEYEKPSSTQSFASSPIVSPLVSNNSIIFPLTPTTPASSKLDFGQQKKRKLNTFKYESTKLPRQSYIRYNFPAFESCHLQSLESSAYQYANSFM